MSGYYNRNNRGITKKLGPVTAYADAVLAGYTGTREQWAQDMAKLGQNVTQVSQNTKLTTELAEQTRENTEQVAKDTADVRRLADETSDNAVQVASNTAESNRLAEETKQAAAQAKVDAEYAGAAADNFRVDTTLSEAGKAAEAKATGEKFAQLLEEIDNAVNAPAEAFTDASYIKHADGTVGENYNRGKASDYVPTFNGTKISLSGYITDDVEIPDIIGLAFYDQYRKYISGVPYGDGGTITADVPENAVYVRYTILGDCVDTYTFTQNRKNEVPIITSRSVALPEEWKRTGRENIDAVWKYAEEPVEMTMGYYVTNKYEDGRESAVSFGAVSDYVSTANVSAVYTCLAEAMAICFYDVNKTYISAIEDTDSMPKIYRIDIPNSAVYMRISCDTRNCDKDDVRILKPFDKTLNFVEEKTYITPYMTSGNYVSVIKNGTVSSVSYAYLSDYVDLYGVERVYTALSTILAICYYDLHKNYLGGMTANVDGEASWWCIEPPAGAVYMRISLDGRVITASEVKIEYSTTKKINGETAEERKYKESVAEIPTQNIISMYDTVVCIGDSLTWSQVYTSANTQRQAFRTYGAVLGALCGVDAKTYATPGDTAITWWTRSSAGAFDNHGLYIVFLGTNYGVTDTIDTDCVGNDPDAFATTLTGQYGRILQTIKNNGDKAVLVLPWKGGGDSLETTREVIGKFGNLYNFPVIDITFDGMNNDAYHNYPDGTGKNGLHYNDLGYAKMANVVMQKINTLSLDEQYKIMRTQ